MAILDTFFYILDADARKLEQGLKDADAATDKLKKHLDDTDKTGGALGKTLLGVAGSIGTAIGGVLAFGAIAATTREVADFADELNDAAEAIGVSVSDLHAWDNAATTTGGQAKAFTASLNTLNTGMNAIATKGKGLLLPFFEQLGLSLDDIKAGAKDPISALLKLSDSFKGLSKAEAAGIGSKMGLDQGTINLLSQGREGVLQLVKAQKELGVVTDAQAQASARFNDEVEATGRVYEDVKRQIVTTYLPAVSDAIAALRSVVVWMRDNKPFVIGFFGSVAAILTGVLLPSVISVAAAVWTIVGPFVAVAAIALAVGAAIGLLADDLYNFMQGNDSAIGELVKKWPLLGDAIHAIGDGLAWLVALVGAFASSFVTLIKDGPEAALASFSDQVNSIVDDVARRFPRIAEAFKFVSSLITAEFQGLADGWAYLVSRIQAGIDFIMRAVQAVRGARDAVAGFFFGEKDGAAASVPADTKRPAGTLPDSAQGQAARAGVEAGRAQIAAAGASPLVSQSSSAITSRTTNTKQTDVRIDRVEVNTQASDGAGVATALTDHLGAQLRGAIDQNDDGVLA